MMRKNISIIIVENGKQIILSENQVDYIVTLIDNDTDRIVSSVRESNLQFVSGIQLDLINKDYDAHWELDDLLFDDID
jgi:hypothetical protein